MNLTATHAGNPREPRGGTMRFTYPSGSRPLDGYTIKRGIGRGGFGEVYYATSDAGKEVALKLIRRNLEIELRGVTQCLNLKHSNLLGLYDIRQDEHDDSWVVMEYVNGESLEDVITRHPGGLPLVETLAWFRGIAAGVGYLHDHGIVHRDLKPGNIFSDDGMVKIGDYGLSKFISASRRSGQTESVGTVHYMAPEIANGRYGKQIDIYALGIILYEMLTGQVPFEGESVGEVLMKHLTAQPDLSRVAEPFRQVIARCLNKDPEARFSSVTDLLALLPGGAVPSMGAGRLPLPPLPPIPNGATTQPLVGAAGSAAPEVEDEEPIWRAVRLAWRQLVDAWNSQTLTKPAKFVLIVVGIYLLVSVGGVLLPVAFSAIVCYAVYRIVRSIVLTSAGVKKKQSPPPPTPPPSPAADPLALTMAFPAAEQAVVAAAPVTPQPVHGCAKRSRRREKPVRAMPVKTPREKSTELVGSLLGAAIVASVVSCVLLLLRGGREFEVRDFVWLELVSVAASWGILIPAKFWEGTQGEGLLRRFVLLAVGLGVGAVAAGTADAFNMHFVPGQHFDADFRGPIGDMLLSDLRGQPLTTKYLAYFALLFPVLRWWKQADPLRPARLSIWNTAVCGAWAFVLGQLFEFPAEQGMMTAVATSVTVQVCSPWLNPKHNPEPPALAA